MPVVSSLFLVIALSLAVVIGPQTRAWTWGPAMLSLGVSVMAALQVFWRRSRFQSDAGLLAFAWLVVGWFTWRACASPVAELARTDLLLLCGTVASFTSVRAINGHAAAERVLFWGVGLLLLASAAVAGMQFLDPSYSPVFPAEATTGKVIGFYAHYNEAANYFIASTVLTGAAALSGRHANATRLLWCVTAVAGLACVWLTRSRGGILGATIGCGVLFTLLLVVGKRRNAKWFAPVLIALPVIGLAIGTFWWMGWQEAQLTRTPGNATPPEGIAIMQRLLDNNARLYLLGIALSCIGLHPLAGGGSRSFSWDSYGFVDPRIQGLGGHRPDMVHNELLQSATDYGLTGASLLAALLVILSLASVLRIFFENRPREADGRDAWRIGALAALAGMFVQSCFSFVFHLMPGVILLGICLGMLSRTEAEPSGIRTLAARVMLTLAAIGCALMLLPAGWKGTRATLVLWSTWFSKQPETSAESRIDALTEAIRIWPLAELYQTRGEIFQKLSLGQAGSSGFTEPANLAMADYLEAARLHPYEPGYPINRANLLSQLGCDADAEAAYASGIRLQGGMEPGFRGHFSLANHHFRKGLKCLEAGHQEEALASLEIAADEIETACSMMHWVTKDMVEPRIAIHESLGTLREATGDREGALAAYDFAAALHQGKRVHYRAAVLIGKTAVEAWSQRQPSKAMALFIEARKRIGQAGGELPAGITPSQQAEYIAYLDRTIAFLKGAKVRPEE
jgi:tetratricopeptide (TPR) repeat protein